LEDVYRALEWRLCREPEEGAIRISRKTPVYLMPSKPWVDAPRLVVLYRFDDKRVTVLSVRATEPKDA
jgi:hypothetical protein